jgi:hypothetical protein
LKLNLLSPLRFDKRIRNYYWGSPPFIWGTAGGILFPPDFYPIGDEVHSTIHLHRNLLLSSHFTDTASLPGGLAAAEKS